MLPPNHQLEGVQTWVTSQWKFMAIPGQLSVQINKEIAKWAMANSSSVPAGSVESRKNGIILHNDTATRFFDTWGNTLRR